MVQVLALGLISAGIYGMFAVGIVLVYRGTRVLSFAGGEVGTAALYVAAWLVTDHKLPWIVGAVVAVALAALAGMAFEFLLVRRSVDADPVVTAILTVGLAVTLLAIEARAYGPVPRKLAPPLSGGINVDGVVVSATQILAIVAAVALGLGLQAVMRRTDFGLGILAAAEDPSAARLVGVPLSRVRLALWGASFALAAIAALLVEPTVGIITPGYASTLYLGGLAAAVIGGLSSLPGAVVGALVVGIGQSIADRLLGDKGIPGLDDVVVLALLLITLLGRAVLPDLRRRMTPLQVATEAAA